jgi:hypothetical protein
MGIFPQIVVRIIQEQELVIGPIAWEEARKIEGLVIDAATKKVSFTNGNEIETINKLVMQYQRLFGQASVEVCRDAVKDLIADAPQEQVPSLLK